MTDASCCDLLDGKAEAGQTFGVPLCLDVAGEYGDPRFGRKALQGPFKQGGLAGTWRADEVDAENLVRCVAFAQRIRDALVLAKDFGL
jgi:hypothetical protein